VDNPVDKSVDNLWISRPSGRLPAQLIKKNSKFSLTNLFGCVIMGAARLFSIFSFKKKIIIIALLLALSRSRGTPKNNRLFTTGAGSLRSRVE